MTRLLVSVSSVAECRVVLAGEATLIDIKSPRRGALGASAPRTIEAIVRQVAQRRATSAALGELADWVSGLAPAHAAWLQRLARDESLPRPRFFKLGLAQMRRQPNWPGEWQRALRRLPAGACPVAVVYADWRFAGAPRPAEVLETAVTLGCRALLVDTYSKGEGSLFDHLSHATIERLLQSARREGLVTVVAGSLTAALLPRAIALGPDFVAVRGAVCGGARTATISPKRLARFESRLAAALCTRGAVARRTKRESTFAL